MGINKMKMIQISAQSIKDSENEKNSFEHLYTSTIDDKPLNRASHFTGKAFIYDEEIFVNTVTGEGYESVIKKMKHYIDWYSGKIRLSGFDRDDIKQLIVLILLDGIRRYNPALKIKLSTFLYVHIKNRIISRIKEETRQSSNATYQAGLHKFICPCGACFTGYKNQSHTYICKVCMIAVNDSWSIRAEHIEPISLDAINIAGDDGIDNSNYYNVLIDFFGKNTTIEHVEKNLDITNILRSEDDTTRKIAELMYHQDYSITDAAKEVGLTCWAASLRLKKLKSNKEMKDFFINT
jgi:RNA polymerase sigma factor (sigma-70 family)